MNITLFITEDCLSCQRVENQVRELIAERIDINLLVEDIKNVDSRGIIIAPALFVEAELFSYGEVDKQKLLARLDLTNSAN